MGQLITASINLLEIDKTKIIEGKKGKYLNLTIWINETPDKFGNDVSLEQRVDKGEKKIYLGNGKTYKKSQTENNEGKFQKNGKVQTDSLSNIDDLF